MSTTLKVLSAKKVIASHQIKQGDTLVIEARDKSNYQLIDDQTGFGPQNIIAKRDGKDLKIFLEDGDMNPDVVIKGYYGDENSEDVTNLIVGQHENGGVYAYVPESGLKADAVSMLAEEVAAPQALGGEEIGAFWAFNPWWLLALVPLAAGIAIAAGGGGGGGGSKDTDGPTAPDVEAKDNGDVVVTPKDDSTKTTVDYTDEEGNDQTIVVEKDPETGKWVDPNPNDNITVDPDTGVITIPEDNIKGGTDVTAKTEDPDGNESKETTVPSKDTDQLPKVEVPENSDGGINAGELENGIQVEVTPPKNNTKPGDKVVVELKDKDGNPVIDPNTNEPVKVEKEIPEGWKPGDVIDVTIPKESLPTDENGKVKDGDYTVVGKVEDPAGNVSKETKEPISIDTGVPGDSNDDGKVDDKDDSPKEVELPIDKDGDGNNDKVPANTDGAPNIVFGEDTNNDGTLNNQEVGTDGQTPVYITIPDGTEKGDTLVITINGKPKEVEVTEEMLTKGYHQENVPVTADTTEISITAKVKDPAGNESATGNKSVTVDTLAPTAPKSVE
ncbi:hypothetical protein BKK49_10585, partial [Rodentibacter rarus]